MVHEGTPPLEEEPTQPILTSYVSTINRNNAVKSSSMQWQQEGDNSILKYFGYTVITLMILNLIFRFFKYVILITVLMISLIIISLFTISSPFNSSHNRHKIRDKFTRFKFSKTEQIWQAQRKEIQEDQIFVPSGDEKQSVAPFIDYLIRDFINSWYVKISPGLSDKRFGFEIKKVLNLVIRTILIRFERLEKGNKGHQSSEINAEHYGGEEEEDDHDKKHHPEKNDAVAKILVLDLIPLITKHFSNFVIAQDLVSGDKKASGSSAELDFKIMKEYAANRKLHAFNTGSLKTSTRLSNGNGIGNDNELENSMNLQHRKFARDRFAKVLKLILPQSESSSHIVTILLRELVTNIVLAPMLAKISDADFWNQTIVQLAGSVLMDRAQVRELRQVIDQQYDISDEGRNKNRRTKTTKEANDELVKMKVTPTMKQAQFEKLIKGIEICDSLSVLKLLKYTVSVQISRILKYQDGSTNREKFLKYKRRLEICKTIIDTRLATLTSSTSSTIAGEEVYTTNSKRTSRMFANPDLDAFINNLTLTQILNNPTSLSYFMEFMKRRQREVLLQYWITVNRIKDPLEDPYTLEEYDSFTKEDCDDIVDVYERFFNDKHEGILKISEDFKSDVFSFVEFITKNDISSSSASYYYTMARRAILLLQANIQHRMNERDLGEFKSYPLFLKLLESETFEQSLVWDVQQANNISYSGDESSGSEADISNKIESAITDILLKASSEGENKTVSVYSKIPKDGDFISRKSNVKQAIDAGSFTKTERATEEIRSGTQLRRSEIFGNEDADFDNSNFLNHTKPLFSRRPLLFGEEEAGNAEEEEEQEEQDESHDSSSTRSSSSVELFNTVDLKASISTLANDIERLTQQSSLLDPLILKAELTNNTKQLHLLKKSKSSYQREIEIKDLQKQQLIIQNNENSLFGQTELSINSYVTANDGDYIVYVIDVQKGDKSWMIGRRFSQFYGLNEILKKRYPNLMNGVSFPRKKMNYLILNYKQRQFIEERRGQLESYLRKMLNIPGICQDGEFRRFLTLDDYKPPVGSLSDSGTLLSSPISSLNFTNSSNENLLNNSASNNITDTSSGSENFNSSMVKIHQVLEMRNEVDSYNKILAEQYRYNQTNGAPMHKGEKNSTSSSSTGSFIKPIIDLFLVLFQPTNTNLNSINFSTKIGSSIILSSSTTTNDGVNSGTSTGSTWLRGRALVLVLQQIFGSTIENYLKEKVNNIITGNNVNRLIQKLTDSFWPNGGEFQKGSKPSNQRTTKEQIETRTNSKFLLDKLLTDTCLKIVGSSSVKYASLRIHSMVQNQVLNVNLIYEIVDLILVELFPELAQELDQ